jgi:hypothetical protein
MFLIWQNELKTKMLWCWRCRQEMPMLDEQEYTEAFRLYGECMKGAKEFRQQWNVPLASASIDEHFRPIREWYEQLTGVPGCHANAIMHQSLVTLWRPVSSLREAAPLTTSKVMCFVWNSRHRGGTPHPILENCAFWAKNGVTGKWPPRVPESVLGSWPRSKV